jgi:hypothetical protein
MLDTAKWVAGKRLQISEMVIIGTETEIDTTKFSLLDLTYKWSAADASNSITVKQANFEIKRQW